MYPRFITAALIILATGMTFLTGCQKSPVSKPLNDCDTTNTTFSKLYASLLGSSDNIDDTTYDGRVHSFTFKVSNEEIICKIGYQNLGSPRATQPDLIEIYDSVSRIMLYTGSHFFDSSKLSYVSVGSVVLETGHSYTVKRTRSYDIYFGELIGRIVRSKTQELSFPITFDNLEITSSNFYISDEQQGLKNMAIPYIDVVFQ